MAQPLYHTTGCKMTHFARALQRCSKVAGVAATSVATATFCDAAINKKDFTPLIVARNDKIGQNVHKVTLAFPAVHQLNCRVVCDASTDCAQVPRPERHAGHDVRGHAHG